MSPDHPPAVLDGSHGPVGPADTSLEHVAPEEVSPALHRAALRRARILGEQLPKPRLRGMIHLIMFPSAMIAGLVLVAFGGDLATRLACVVYVTTAGLLFGRLRGGIAVAVVLVGLLLAATTGVVAATVVTMGLISLPIMLRYGYDKGLASGVIAASGTLGQVIPPSVVLVVLGSELGVSVGDLFLGSLVPGLMLAALYIVYVIVRSALSPTLAPAMPAAELNIKPSAMALQVLRAMIPPLLLIFYLPHAFIVPVWSPTWPLRSRPSTHGWPLSWMSKTRDPGAEVHEHLLARKTRTWTGVPAVTGNDQSISLASPGSHRSESKTAFGVLAGTVESTLAPEE